MPTIASQQLIERIHATATPLVLAVTGGGSGALSTLLAVPGASATVLEAVVPYAPTALALWLGGPPDQACSEATARAMAMAALERARRLSLGDPRGLRGIGATASLATTRPKRGPHRIHVAWQSTVATVVTSCELSKGERGRAVEEEIASRLVIDAVAEACGVEAASQERVADGREPVNRRELRAPSEWTELLLGERPAVLVSEREDATKVTPQSCAFGRPLGAGAILFPGAFHPLHEGHERMAAIAAERCGGPITWELSVINVDKPPLDFIEISDRLAGLSGRRVLLTHAPTFVEKAALAPGCTFVVGADTIERIADPRYYGGDSSRRDAAVAAIAARGCRFLVFGRLLGERFHTLSDLDLPAALQALCEQVPVGEFRQDVASSVIRTRN